MAIYWSIKSLPEVAALPKNRRKELWRECVRHTSPGPWYWLGFLPVWIAVYFLIQSTFRSLIFRHHIVAGGVVGGLGSAFWGIALGLVGNHMKIARSLPAIRRRLGGLCPGCGYDLRATPDRCPECGATVAVQPNIV